MSMFFALSFATAALLQPSSQVQATGEQQPSQAAQRTASLTTGAGRDRVICRRQTRTGTLSGTQTVCHTAAEWEALSRGTGESWRQIQGTFGSTNDRGGDIICRPNGVGC